MTYETPAALRAALEARLRDTAQRTGTDLGRVRRRVVFERLLSRLAADDAGRWVLKGGFALEIRNGDAARATRDLDLATAHDDGSGASVRDHLIEGLGRPDGDGFTFEVGPPRELTPDQAGRSAWRFAVEAKQAGRTFDRVRVDVVARPQEFGARTERLVIVSSLRFAGFDDVAVLAVDRRQHFAEKLHALTRDYGDRENTRVKDLLDLVLLIDDGLAPDQELVAAVQHLFSVRATHSVPDVVDAPPSTWRLPFERLANEVGSEVVALDAAAAQVDAFWRRALQANSESS